MIFFFKLSIFKILVQLRIITYKYYDSLRNLFNLFYLLTIIHISIISYTII